jgi:hypothetical protein
MAKRKYQQRDSGLFVPGDDSIELPKPRAPKPWYAGVLSGMSNRFMGRRRCCGGGGTCTIFSDDFSVDDLAAEWTQVSGSWSIGSGVLSTSSSNAVLVCDTEYPGGVFGNHVIQTSLKASTGNYSRIIFNYHSGSYYHIEVYWNGSSSYVYIKTSGGSTIATSAVQSFTDGVTYSFRVCVERDQVFVNVNDSYVIGKSYLSGTNQFNYTTCGVGTGSTSSSLQFDNYVFSYASSENQTCPDCNQPCIYCEDGVGPEFFQLTVSDVTGSSDRGDCSNCSIFNATYICYKYGTISCSWRSDYFTVENTQLDGENTCAGSGTYWWTITAKQQAGVYKLTVELHVSSTTGTCRCGLDLLKWYWEYRTDSLVDCDEYDEYLTRYGDTGDSEDHQCEWINCVAYGCFFGDMKIRVKSL